MTDNTIILKQLNHFVRKHEFFGRLSLVLFATSDRRKFERDVYDFGRSLGLSKRQAREELRKARAFCGEEDYDSDKSAWRDEIDDSLATLGKLSNLLPHVRVKDPMESVCLFKEQNASFVPDTTQGMKEEEQEKSNLDLEKIVIGSETTVPELPMASTTKAESTKSKKRKSVGTDVNVKANMEKKIRQKGTRVLVAEYEDATQTVQPMNVDEDEKRKVRRDRKRKKRSLQSSNTKIGSVDLPKLDSEEENSQANPNSKTIKPQNLQCESPQGDKSEKAEGVEMELRVTEKIEDISSLYQQSKQVSIENKENRDASHQGFPSPMS